MRSRYPILALLLSQRHAFAVGAQQAQVEALVQSLLALFIAKLGTVKEELGRDRERREQAEQERDELKTRIEALEATKDAPEPQDIMHMY